MRVACYVCRVAWVVAGTVGRGAWGVGLVQGGGRRGGGEGGAYCGAEAGKAAFELAPTRETIVVNEVVYQDEKKHEKKCQSCILCSGRSAHYIQEDLPSAILNIFKKKIHSLREWNHFHLGGGILQQYCMKSSKSGTILGPIEVSLESL